MKSHVSMEQHQCLVCGKNYDTGAVLLDKRLRPSLEQYTVTGNGLCPEHKKLFDDGYVALVEVSADRKHRTGNLAHVSRRVWNDVFDTSFDERAPMAYVEVGVIEKLAAMATA